MRLYLVRHAIAFDRDATRWPDDGERPLTPEGRQRFERAARGVRALAPAVDVLLTSPLARARDTAEILEHEARWPAPTPCDELRPGSDPAAAASTLSAFGDRATVAAVGHEPDLHELLSYLLAGERSRVASAWRKGAVASLVLPAPAAPASAVLEWFVQPSTLRRLAR